MFLLNKFCLLFLCLFLCYTQSFSQFRWEKLEDFPGHGRDDAALFSIGDSVCFGTGYAAGIGPSQDFYSYIDNSWNQIRSLPADGRQYSVGFSWQGKGYLATGIDVNNKCLNENWQYDPETDSWQEKKPLPGKGRLGSVIFQFGESAIIAGGADSIGNILSEVWEYNIAQNTWQRKADMPFGGRMRASGNTVGKYGYLFFGNTSSSQVSSEVYRYDSENDSWQLWDAFPGAARFYSTSAITKDGWIVIGFGTDRSGSLFNDLYLYDPANKIWDELIQLPASGRRGAMGFVNKGDFYLVTGRYEAFGSKEVWVYKMVTGNTSNQEVPAFNIYPNPVTEVLNFDFTGNEYCLMKVFDLAGSIILEAPLSNKIILPSSVKPGMYLLQIISGDEVLWKEKLIVR